MIRPASVALAPLVVLFAFVSLAGGAPGEEELALPAATRAGSVSVEAALAQRRSVRSFAANVPTRKQIGQLLWAAQGVTGARGHRTAPSAGALYPLDVYVATPDGVFHYVPKDHRLALVTEGDVRPALYRAALSQEAVRDAPVVFVITGEYARTSRKYGGRAERYVHIEVGHAAQNLLLQATALGLAGVPIGAFTDAEVKRVLGCPTTHAPLCLIPIGRAE